MTYAIKVEIQYPRVKAFVFTRAEDHVWGKHIAEGDIVFVFASENEGGKGLIARGVVTSAAAVAKKRSIARQTPRVSVTIRRTALARRPFGRSELKKFSDWNDGRPESSISNSTVRRLTRSSAFRMR